MEEASLCGVSYPKKQSLRRVCMQVASLGKRLKRRVRNEQKYKEGRKVWQVCVTELDCGCSSPPGPPTAEDAEESSIQVQANEGSSEKCFIVHKDGLGEVAISLPLFQPLTLLPIREVGISCHMKGGWYAEDQSLQRGRGGQSLMTWLSYWVIQPRTFLPLDVFLMKGMCFPCSGHCGLDLQSRAAESTPGWCSLWQHPPSLDNFTFSPSLPALWRHWKKMVFY